MHVHQQIGSSWYFARDHLVSAGKWCCEVLIALEYRDEALECVLLLRDYLIVSAADVALSGEEREYVLQQFHPLDIMLVEGGVVGMCLNKGAHEASLHSLGCIFFHARCN